MSDEVAFATAEILDSTHCTVFRVSDTDMHVVAAEGKLAAYFAPGRSFKLGEGIAGWVAQKGEAALVPNTSSDPRFAQDWTEKDQPRSLVVAPVFLGGRVWGVISAEQEQINAFDTYDQQLLEALALQFRLALRNTHLHQSERQKADLLGRLNQVLTIMTQIRAESEGNNLDMVMPAILSSLDVVLGKEPSSCVDLFDSHAKAFGGRFAHGPLHDQLISDSPRADGTRMYVASTGRPLYIEDTSNPTAGYPDTRETP